MDDCTLRKKVLVSEMSFLLPLFVMAIVVVMGLIILDGSGEDRR